MGTPTIGYVLYEIKTYMDGTEVEQIIDIPLPEGKTGTIDLTNQDSGWVTEKTAGRFDASEISLKGIYAGLPGQLALKAAWGDNKRHSFTFDLPDGTHVSFLASVGSFSITNEKDAEGFTVNLIVFGKATYSATYAALTTFSVGTGGTLVPAATLTHGEYAVVSTAATVPLTCADSVSGAAIYVNGTKNTSWPYSVTTPIGITTVLLRVTEDDKADANYILKFVRSS
ncbi:MAG: hypothetical protein ABFD07_14240 [Methanobacterium sp.]